MKICVKQIVSVVLVFTVMGCSTISTIKTGEIDASSKKEHGVYVTNFKAEKSRGSLFVSGTLVNHSGYTIINTEIEARGYNKNGELVSTDNVMLDPSQIKNDDKVNFSMIFVKNVDQIENYYFFGKYKFISKNITVNWKAIGTVVLIAGTVVAIAASAYYSAGSGSSGSWSRETPAYNPPVYSPPQRTGCVWQWDCSRTPCVQVPLCDSVTDIIPPRTPSVPPIPPPSIKPIKAPSVPLIGTTHCEQRYICDNNSNCFWKEICQ